MVVVIEEGAREEQIQNVIDRLVQIGFDLHRSTGSTHTVGPMARAAVAAGADGLLIQGHHARKTALCDGAQSLDRGSSGSSCRRSTSLLPPFSAR